MQKRSVLLLAAVLLSFYCQQVCCVNVTVYKCCSNKTDLTPTENVTGDIEVEEDVVFSLNNTIYEGDVHLNESYSIVANECHQDENSLQIELSLDPTAWSLGFLKNGYLQNGQDHYAPTQYCIDGYGEDGSLKIKTTENMDCVENTCLRKCCGEFEVYDLSTYGNSSLQCVPSVDNPWVPVVYPIPGDPTDERSEGNHYVRLRPDHPRNWCSDPMDTAVIWSMRNIGTDRKKLFRILSNGSVMKRDGIKWRTVNTSRICIDGAINIPGHFDPEETQTTFSGDEMDTIVLECRREFEDAPKAEPPTILYGVALAISVLFLLATLIIYGLLWDKQNIHGWSLIGFAASMLLFYLSLLAAFFHRYYFPDEGYVTEAEVLSSSCGVIAITTHFLYISFVCWLTIISFDIFSKFRILKLKTRSKNREKFIAYLVFTLFVPTTIIVIGIILDITYGDLLDPSPIILPRYGWKHCFIDLEQAALPYLFAPIGVLLTLNCVLYLATIFHIHKLQEATKFASRSSSKVQQHRPKIRLFSKLFLLMGINWVSDFVSFVVFGAEANITIIIVDVINILQPVVVFIIFVCKREILESLCKKYSTLSKIIPTSEHEDSTASSASTRNPWIWNPVASTRWFRDRVNSTMTDTSNLSVRSAYASETPTPSPIAPRATSTLEKITEVEPADNS